MGDVQMETAQFGNVFFHESNFGNYTFFWGLKKREKKKEEKKMRQSKRQQQEKRNRKPRMKYPFEDITCKAIKLTREFSSF